VQRFGSQISGTPQDFLSLAFYGNAFSSDIFVSSFFQRHHPLRQAQRVRGHSLNFVFTLAEPLRNKLSDTRPIRNAV
jgi:hypothetical protein